MRLKPAIAGLSLAFAIYGCSPKAANQKIETSTAQTPLIPADSNVIIGKLPNGLTYYIRKNTEPKNRAELYLANKIGSLMETDEQQGLAHFTEHMAFNGTRDFPKNELISYLQKAGVRFGADLNAYTGFNQTVFQLPLPTDSTEVFEKGFDILANWAGHVSFEDKEIDQERGIIIEEDRQRGKNAQERMSKQLLPILLANSRYADRLPIGKIDILQNFKYETIKQFYHDWYRPNLQAVIAVGDFDVKKVEELIKANFSDLKNPENEKKREQYGIPGNEEPLVKIVTDPEFPYVVANVTWKHPEIIEKNEAELMDKIRTSLMNNMLNNRITEIIQKGNAPFVYALSNYSSFQGGLANLDAFTTAAVAKDASGLKTALQSVLAENIRMQKFGFTETELARAKINLMTSAEKQYKEKDKTKSTVFVQHYLENFLNGTAIPSIDYTYQFYKNNLDNIDLESINQLAKKMVTEENMIAIIQAPEKEKANLPSEDTLVQWIHSAGEGVTPYVDNVVNEPLMAKTPKAGTITSEKINSEQEAGSAKAAVPERADNKVEFTELKLSNGMTVILKPTTFKNDQILFSATAKGGTSLASEADFRSAQMADQLVDASGLANFDATQLGKLLTGKVVGVSPNISTYRQGMSGSASPKDLETAMQLIHLYFTAPRIDDAVLQTQLDEMRTVLVNRLSQPTAVYGDTISAVMSGYHPRAKTIGIDELSQINKEKALAFYKERFANAADFTFTFVGNFDIDTIKPLIATYLGSLPSNQANPSNYRDLDMDPLQGNLTKKVYKGLEDKANVNLIYHGKYEYSDANNLQLDAIKEALDIKITERLREKESGVYSPRVGVQYGFEPSGDYQLSISFSCATANVDKLIKAAVEEVNAIKANGATEEDITKFKAEERRQMENLSRENGFWLNHLQNAAITGKNPDDILNYISSLSQVTQASTKEAANKYFDESNFIRFILLPEKKF